MKRLLCLMLALALVSLALTGCRKKQEEPAEEASSSSGPGYTATDGSQYMPSGENSVPDPLATLTPQQMAAMQVGTPDDTLSGEGAPPPEGGTVAADDLFAPIDMGGAEAQLPAAPAQEAVTNTATEAPAVYGDQVIQVVNPMSYQYAAVMDDTLDYTFNYPTHWEHVPGIYTVCYREKVEQGDFPARVSVCRKKLVHTPDELMLNEQLTSYLKMVAEHYDEKTFQTGTPEKDIRFMGHKLALANTYLAYWGDIEVKGYVVGVAYNRTLYVLHFCATYADYAALDGVREYIVNSCQLKEDEKKK